MKDFIKKVAIVLVAIVAFYYFLSPYEECMRARMAEDTPEEWKEKYPNLGSQVGFNTNACNISTKW